MVAPVTVPAEVLNYVLVHMPEGGDVRSNAVQLCEKAGRQRVDRFRPISILEKHLAGIQEEMTISLELPSRASESRWMGA